MLFDLCLDASDRFGVSLLGGLSAAILRSINAPKSFALEILMLWCDGIRGLRRLGLERLPYTWSANLLRRA